jgi:hypothetical protein
MKVLLQCSLRLSIPILAVANHFGHERPFQIATSTGLLQEEFDPHRASS